MSLTDGRRRRTFALAAVGALLLFGAESLLAQRPSQRPSQRDTTGAGRKKAERDTTTKKVDDSLLRGTLEIYGFGQGDMIYDFKRTNPLWFDVNRPTKLPATVNEFGKNHNTWFSARQSRFGAKGTFPTKRGEVFANFDFDMFGVGIDAGQTTIRLRHAYGEWQKFGAGQLESQFMDLDVFPNILDYWGPNGMLFFRNVQVYWKPIDHGETRLSVALERPGASADAGFATDRIELQNVKPRFPAPDVTASYRTGAGWGYWKIAGIWRDIRWDQVPVDTFDLSGHVTGWGVSTSSNLRFWEGNVFRLQANYGEGIQNYFNDAPVDVGAEFNLDDPRTPLTGKALPIFGAVVFLDHTWDKHWSSAIGWSMVNITNSDAQLPTAFHNGQYAIANLLWTPVTDVMMGLEFQYGRRTNNGNNNINFPFEGDKFVFNGYRLQFSGKYTFAKLFGAELGDNP